MFSCNSSSNKVVTINEKNLQDSCVKYLTEVIVYDIFSPPVASRIYAYSNLAFYEAIKYKNANAISVTAKLKRFDAMPIPDKNVTYNFMLSGMVAFFDVSKALCFSKDSIQKKYENLLYAYKINTNTNVFKASVAFGNAIAIAILKRAGVDNYKYIKGLPKYSVFKAKGQWQQTPPDYMDAVEPNWHLLMPMLIDSANRFTCLPPPAYSEDKNSVYYKEMQALVDMNKYRTSAMDTIATYWDDNPFVTVHKGHFMMATKKITPGGHWMGITSILCKQQQVDEVKAALLYALTACSIYDGFIACWHVKYTTKMVRPITVIRELVDPNWNSFLQTPPFPEYTSGHSVISTAAATVLTHHLNDSLSFLDTTEKNYLGMQRSFTSIYAAAEEACISRLYGGIHYNAAVTQGKAQGKKIGDYYNRIVK